MIVHWFDAGPASPALIGGKGATLAALRAAAFPVPAGFCVSVNGYRRFAATAGLAPLLDALRDRSDVHLPDTAAHAAAPLLVQHDAATLPPLLRGAILAAHTSLHDRLRGMPLVAVRSSAASEDGVQASFAGLYRSYLNVGTSDGVLNAVLGCYRSLWEAPALQYRAAAGLDQTADWMAVVVMPMVPAAVAGVAFSVNPATGNPDEVVINASWGLGETVVRGRVTPDHVIAAKTNGTMTAYEVGEKAVEIVLDGRVGHGTVERAVEPGRAGQRCLSNAAVQAIVKLAAAVERYDGRPQDIEFAFADGELFLLQARPVTGLPAPALSPGEAAAPFGPRQ